MKPAKKVVKNCIANDTLSEIPDYLYHFYIESFTFLNKRNVRNEARYKITSLHLVKPGNVLSNNGFEKVFTYTTGLFFPSVHPNGHLKIACEPDCNTKNTFVS